MSPLTLTAHRQDKAAHQMGAIETSERKGKQYPQIFRINPSQT